MTETVAAAPPARSRPRPLRAAIDRLQPIDPRNTWQVVAGAIFVPLGIVIILIGWYGAAHASVVQQQIPYLVSGSFIGLGFMVLGGLLYWAHWLYRVYDQADLQHAAQLARQEELFERLIEAVAAGAALGAARPARADATVAAAEPARVGSERNSRRASAVAPDAFADALVVTASGSNVHRADCPIVARHTNGLRRVAGKDAAGLRPCRICQPGLA